MEPTKELAIKMLDYIEELYFENSFLKTLLTRNGTEYLDRQMEFARKQTGPRQQVADLFSPLRQRILEEHDLAEAISEFLRVVQKKKDVN